MSTHINDKAHFAKTVLMPGDPKRAKWIAENFLADYEEVSNVRGILAFTGHTQEGKEISVVIEDYDTYNLYGRIIEK